MALSKADQAFYEEKLSYKSIGILFGSTCVLGTILFPLVTYVQVGDAKSFSTTVASNLAIEGFLLGTIVSFVLYMSFKFLLSVGWLPKRR